jgi:hypothetical protein
MKKMIALCFAAALMSIGTVAAQDKMTDSKMDTSKDKKDTKKKKSTKSTDKMDKMDKMDGKKSTDKMDKQ